MSHGRTVSKRRVLFMAPVEPWCRENGSSLIIADLLEGLGATGDVDLLPVFMRKPPPGYQRRVPEGLTSDLLDIEGLPRWRSIAGAALLGTTPMRMRFDNSRVTQAVERLLSDRGFQPDLVHVEHLPLVDIGLPIARDRGAPLVFREHNVESQLWERRLGRTAAAAVRPFTRRMELAEADATRLAQLSLCISEGDLSWFRDRAPDAEARLFPSSLLMDRYDAVTAVARPSEPQICFVGGLEWAPNEAGLHWFVHEVLPRIHALDPKVRLAVLARGAPDRAWLRDHPSVRVLSAETSAATLFATSRASVAPLLQGGGVRIKIPESLALGCPVVATRIGAEGHTLPGLTVTDDPYQFAETCVRHATNGLGDEDRRALRNAVSAVHDAHGLARKLIGWWSELIEAPSLPTHRS